MAKISLPALLVALLASSAARASDPPAAQALLDQARRLSSEGRHAEACSKLETSNALDPGLGTQLLLADCWQRVGRTASAWALFRNVAAQAGALGQQARQRAASDRAAAIEPLLSKLAIATRETRRTAGVAIERDGAPIARDLWTEPLPVDPGWHVVKVSAPGKRAWETSVHVPPDGKIVTLEVPPLADMGVTQAMPPGPGVSGQGPNDKTGQGPRSESDNAGSGQRALGWFLLGVGAAAFGVGSYYGARSLADRNQSNAHCPDDRCDITGHTLRDDARNHARYALEIGGVGAAVAFSGAVLVLSARAPHMSASLAPTLGGMSVSGVW